MVKIWDTFFFFQRKKKLIWQVWRRLLGSRWDSIAKILKTSITAKIVVHALFLPLGEREKYVERITTSKSKRSENFYSIKRQRRTRIQQSNQAFSVIANMKWPNLAMCLRAVHLGTVNWDQTCTSIREWWRKLLQIGSFIADLIAPKNRSKVWAVLYRFRWWHH